MFIVREPVPAVPPPLSETLKARPSARVTPPVVIKIGSSDQPVATGIVMSGAVVPAVTVVAELYSLTQPAEPVAFVIFRP